MSSYWILAAVLLLLIACAGLWYGSRAVGRTRKAPAWAASVDRYRGLFVGLLVLAVLALVAFAAVPLLAPLFS